MKKDSTVKNSHNVVYFAYLGRNHSAVLTETKICMLGILSDIFTCAKFRHEIFLGYDFTGWELSVPFSC